MNRRGFLKMGGGTIFLPLVSGGGGVHVKSGVVVISGTHYLREPIRVEGVDAVRLLGDDANIFIGAHVPEANYGAIRVEGCKDFSMEGISIYGQRELQGEYEATPPLVRGGFVEGFRVSDCHLEAGKGDGIEPVNCRDVVIQNCSISNMAQHAVHLNGVIGGIVRDNRLALDGNSLISMGHGYSRDVMIVGNRLSPTQGLGSYAIQVGSVEKGGTTIVVVDNHIEGLVENKERAFGVTVAPGVDRAIVAHNTLEPWPDVPWLEGDGAEVAEFGNGG